MVYVAGAKKEKTREEKVASEYRRISKALRAIPADKQVVAKKLMEEAAYLTQIIADSREEIDKNGIIEIYQNGENQSGRKKNPAVEIYDRAVNSYSKIIKQLTDLLPDSTAAREVGATLRTFIEGG